MSSSQNQSRRQNPNYRRPATIAELAERALGNPWDDGRELKYYLRTADRYSREGKESAKRGDLEAAFVEFARAATLVLEKLPSHRDYHTALTATQRHNLGLNGQDILDSLSDLKPKLVERHERWLKANPDGGSNDSPSNISPRQAEEAARQAQIEQDRRVQAEIQDRRRQREEQQQREDDNRARAAAAAASARPPQPAQAATGPSQDYTFARTPSASQDRLRDREEQQRREDDQRARAAAAAASALLPQLAQAGPSQDYTFARPPQQPQSRPDPAFDYDRLNQQLSLHAANQQQQQQQEEMRAREQEIVRRRAEDKRREEQVGIAQRQQEADNAAWTARHSVTPNTGSSMAGNSAPAMPYQPPAPIHYPNTSSLRAPKAMNSRPPSFMDQFPTANLEAPLVMPLESPTRYEGDSTDSEAPAQHHDWRRTVKHRHIDAHRTPTRAPARSPSYPPPMTTTSPPPGDPRILYPQLMSHHQRAQGYTPSLHSMFVATSKASDPASMLFHGDARTPNAAKMNGRSLYGPNFLPPPSPPFHPDGRPKTPPPMLRPTPIVFPPVPSGPQPNPSAPAPAPQQQADSSSRSRPDMAIDLKTVSLPRESLPRFLSIAKVNTSLNRETCGLLLGKDKGHKFVVTTLLIPKQHSTSDTCTMDEEELVMQFTEERGLITLGWIHTHPSQSCFMSSVDLHTHAGFQQMLPESFAVVCAPKSNPNFGIFRLTDPPGLKTILECNAKEAFHPHRPDIPIYTDADKGHVQMKDISLEIVDLR
ncbi:hypothetical protein HGRIS_012180 [Hohenbuehelia grisea]|uniref:MPN domain-containing protein n=1 Tax=Hohenbuehelia grisea TaxID=104357 RepID=A0ABR3IRF6_9AGAR